MVVFMNHDAFLQTVRAQLRQYVIEQRGANMPAYVQMPGPGDGVISLYLDEREGEIAAMTPDQLTDGQVDLFVAQGKDYMDRKVAELYG
jgi:hypothetical protein